jgi:succinyl-diaminopimelate desuccinylase
MQTSEHIRARLAEACMTLVSIPSVTGDEAALAEHLYAWALRTVPQGMPVKRIGNSVLVGQPTPDKPCIALVGHTDTVPPHPEDPSPHIDGDKLVGLGASDMKCSIALMQVLFENLSLNNLPFNVMLILYDKEEGAFADNGLQPVLDTEPSLAHIDLAIAMEPTDNTLQLGCMGGLHAKVVFKGKAAHSARPWQGENAIHKAGAFLQTLHNHPHTSVTVQGLEFKEAISATLATGGRARNVIPEHFELNVNYRFAPVEPVADAITRAESYLRTLAKGADITVVDIAPPGPVPHTNPVLEHFQNVAQVPIQPKQAWTDVARLAAHGIDAVNFGPGYTAQAHQKGEFVSLNAMAQAYEILLHVLTTPLG